MRRSSTQERIGCGYVYDDAHIAPDQAQTEIEGLLGQAIAPRADIGFDSGRLYLDWRHNALALGLASSFFEPLEATSIHATVVQLMLLTIRHLQIERTDDAGRRRIRFVDAIGYSATVVRQVDNFRDFINLHYISVRDESPYWRDRVPGCITGRNRERVAQWRKHPPCRDDCPRLADAMPRTEEQLYYPVLDGRGLLSASAAKVVLAEVPEVRRAARRARRSLQREYRQAAAKALRHGDWLRVGAYVSGQRGPVSDAA